MPNDVESKAKKTKKKETRPVKPTQISLPRVTLPPSTRLKVASLEAKTSYEGTIPREAFEERQRDNVVRDKLRARRTRGLPINVIDSEDVTDSLAEQGVKDQKRKVREERKTRRRKQLREVGYRRVLEYIEAGEIGQAMEKEKWTLSEHISLLIGLVRTTQKESVIMSGLKQLDSIITKSAILALKFNEQTTGGVLAEPVTPLLDELSAGMSKLSNFLEITQGNQPDTSELKENIHGDDNRGKKSVNGKGSSGKRSSKKGDDDLLNTSLSSCSDNPIRDRLGGGSEHFPPNTTPAGLVGQGTARDS